MALVGITTFDQWNVELADMEEHEKHNTVEEGKTDLQQIFTSVKNSPKYPEGFQAARNGTKKLRIENRQLLEKLRQIEASEWRKVYQDGVDGSGHRVSLHYFQSASGKVFDVKVKFGWSNKR
ncbi:MAG: hypothetical protein R3C14_31160 [Caldilineaceae bacterium]